MQHSQAAAARAEFAFCQYAAHRAANLQRPGAPLTALVAVCSDHTGMQWSSLSLAAAASPAAAVCSALPPTTAGGGQAAVAMQPVAGAAAGSLSQPGAFQGARTCRYGYVVVQRRPCCSSVALARVGGHTERAHPSEGGIVAFPPLAFRLCGPCPHTRPSSLVTGPHSQQGGILATTATA
jgi:hypothetical protein